MLMLLNSSIRYIVKSKRPKEKRVRECKDDLMISGDFHI